MSEHVIPVLRSKRAEISGHILDLEKRIARFRADLANIAQMVLDLMRKTQEPLSAREICVIHSACRGT